MFSLNKYVITKKCFFPQKKCFHPITCFHQKYTFNQNTSFHRKNDFSKKIYFHQKHIFTTNMLSTKKTFSPKKTNERSINYCSGCPSNSIWLASKWTYYITLLWMSKQLNLACIQINVACSVALDVQGTPFGLLSLYGIVQFSSG